MSKKILKEIGRFILSVFICIFGCYISIKFFCRSTCSSDRPFGIVYLCTYCNTKYVSMLFLGITFLIESLLVWSKRISKAWLIDLVIILLLWLTALAVVEYAMSPY